MPGCSRKLVSMKLLLDAFWRALAGCLHPRVILWSLLPLLLMLAGALALAWWGWSPAVQAADAYTLGSPLRTAFEGAMRWLGLPDYHAMVPQLLVVMAATPLLVILSLLVVATVMTPALSRLVRRQRFPAMASHHGASLWAGMAWSAGHTLAALVLLGISMPLWLVPPAGLLIPPLIWGWLTCRIMGFDALAEHATADERRSILRARRAELLVMGIVCGLLGAAPGIVWASAAVFMAAFVVLVPVAVWIYAAVLAFTSLWFSHFCLAALHVLRQPAAPTAAAAPAGTISIMRQAGPPALTPPASPIVPPPAA